MQFSYLAESHLDSLLLQTKSHSLGTQKSRGLALKSKSHALQYAPTRYAAALGSFLPMPLCVHNCLVAMRGFVPSKIWLLPPRGLGEQILKTLLGTLSSSLFTQQIGGFSFEVRI